MDDRYLGPNTAAGVTFAAAAAELDHSLEIGRTLKLDTLAAPITSDDLRHLLTYPVEIGLEAPFDGTPDEITLIVGTKISTPMSHAPRFGLHTHLIDRPVPSGSDLYRLGRATPESTFVIVSSAGVAVYGMPPEDASGTRPEVRDLMLSWGDAHGVDFTGISLDVPRKVKDMPLDEQNAMLRQFALETGILWAEMPWEDTAGIEQVVGIINHAPSSTERPPTVA
jgi:hypothetical protein